MPCGERVAIRLSLSFPQTVLRLAILASVGGPILPLGKYLWESQAALRVKRVSINENRSRVVVAAINNALIERGMGAAYAVVSESH
jgi:hypothetical protein